MIVAACDTGTGASTTDESTSTTATRAVRGITLNHTDLTLIPNAGFNQATLTATLIPENASNKKVTWTSSDETVVKVEATGLEAVITALKPGSSTITVTPADTSPVSCVVTVKTVKSFTVIDYQEYYDPNDDFVLGNTKLSVIYEGDTISTVPVTATEAMIVPYLPYEWNKISSPYEAQYGASERKVLHVKYGPVSGSFEVTIRAPRWVTIIGTPKRTVYAIGERFDWTGLTLTASYDIGPNRHGIPITEEIAGTSTQGWSLAVNPAASTGPLIYKGVPTTGRMSFPGGVNLGTLNGMEEFTGISVTASIARVTANGVEYYVPGDVSLTGGGGTPAAFGIELDNLIKSLRGQTATIFVAADVAMPYDTSAELNSSTTNITLVGLNGRRNILKPDNGTNTTPNYTSFTPLFKVSNGASLTLGDNICLMSPLPGMNSETMFQPLVEVSGTLGIPSNFKMEDGSIVRVNIPLSAATGNAGVGALSVQAYGVATIQSGAAINIVPPSAAGPTRYNATPGVWVAPQGTLKMEGGIVGGTPAIPTAGTHIGVGDVVVAGSLVLDNDAFIGRLALATAGKVANALVTINPNWNPSQTIILNLTGNGTKTQIPEWFSGAPLFDGSVSTTMTKFAFERAAATYNGGGFFADGGTVDIATTATTNPALITQSTNTSGTWSSGYELTSTAGTLTVHP